MYVEYRTELGTDTAMKLSHDDDQRQQERQWATCCKLTRFGSDIHILPAAHIMFSSKYRQNYIRGIIMTGSSPVFTPINNIDYLHLPAFIYPISRLSIVIFNPVPVVAVRAARTENAVPLKGPGHFIRRYCYVLSSIHSCALIIVQQRYNQYNAST